MSWVGPKGIVAAAVASLFALQLSNSTDAPIDAEQAELILPLTFLVIVGTVVLQGGTAKPLAKLLKVQRAEPTGYLLAGANENSRFLASFLTQQKVQVILADSSQANIREAQRMGFDVYEGNILSDTVFDDIDLTNIGRLMAMTSSSEVNNLANKYFSNEFGEDNVYRLCSKKELELKDIDLPRNVLFGADVDYLNLAQAIRQHQKMKVDSCQDPEEYDAILKSNRGSIIPLFTLHKGEDPKVVSRDLPQFEKGMKLAYIPEAH